MSVMFYSVAKEMLPSGNAPYGYSVAFKYEIDTYCTDNGEMPYDEVIGYVSAILSDSETINPDTYDMPNSRRFAGVDTELGAFFLAIDIQG
jgi:hypothetical protein